MPRRQIVDEIIMRIETKKSLTKTLIVKMKKYIKNKSILEKLEAYHNKTRIIRVKPLIEQLKNIKKGGDVNLNFFDKIGEGSFGTIYREKKFTDPLVYKMLKLDIDENSIPIKDNIDGLNEKNHFIETFTTFHQTPSSPNVPNSPKSPSIQTLDKSTIGKENEFNFAYILDYFTGDLRTFNVNDVSIETLHSNITSMFLALDEFSSAEPNAFIHCDIKLDNILYDENNIWKLHDFDTYTKVSMDDIPSLQNVNNMIIPLNDTIITPKYYTFTPYYISPFLLCYAHFFKGSSSIIQPKDMFSTYFHVHALLTSKSVFFEQFHSLMSNGTLKDNDNSFKNYKEIACSQNNYTGTFESMITDIVTNKKLYFINIRKSDFFSFGIVMFKIWLDLYRTKDREKIRYADNIVAKLIYMCVIPFWTPNPNININFQHGKFIMYTVNKSWNKFVFEPNNEIKYEFKRVNMVGGNSLKLPVPLNNTKPEISEEPDIYEIRNKDLSKILDLCRNVRKSSL